MWNKLKHFLVYRLYKLLILRVSMIDKDDFTYSKYYKSFCELNIDTNQGRFTIVFKEDRRPRMRVKLTPYGLLLRHYVELIPPEGINPASKTFYDQLVVVVSLNTGCVNRQILAEILLDKYIAIADTI